MQTFNFLLLSILVIFIVSCGNGDNDNLSNGKSDVGSFVFSDIDIDVENGSDIETIDEVSDNSNSVMADNDVLDSLDTSSTDSDASDSLDLIVVDNDVADILDTDTTNSEMSDNNSDFIDDESSDGLITSINNVPKSPLVIVSMALSSSEITMSWTDDSDNEDGFRIERSIDNSNFIEVATTKGTSYTDKSLSENTKYYYNVIAFNSFGDGDAVSTSSTTPEATD